MEPTKLKPSWYFDRDHDLFFGFQIGTITNINPWQLTLKINFLYWELGYCY